MESENIIEKAKELLNISYDIPLSELYNQLWELRNTYHPDKFLSSEAKTKGEKSFKEIGALLNNLHKFIENEKLENDKTKIIPYDEKYEIIKLKQENLNNDQELNSLKVENDYLKTEIKNLENKINEIISKKAKEKEEELMLKYRSSKKSVISIGIIITLTALVSILTKIEEVTNIITKYSPINEDLLNIIMFIVFIITVIICIEKYLVKNYINKLSNIIQTSPFTKKFLITLDGNQDYFSEFNVITYIRHELSPRSIFKKMLIRHFNILSIDTIDSLKDIFIYHLYEKSLIEFQDAHCLDRFFRIKKSYNKDIQDKSAELNNIIFRPL